MGNAYGGGGTLPAGVLGTLDNVFIYGGNPGKFYLTNLTAGQTYVLTFYARAWEGAGARRQNITTTSGASTMYDVDMNALVQGQANLLRYAFVASTNNEVLTITPQVAANTMHTYGFSTEQVFNKSWVSGANWTSATWSPTGGPNAPGANAYFTAPGSPTIITLDAAQTVGNLQFDGANAWTLARANILTLSPDVGAVSVLSTPSGTHSISAPVVLGGEVFKTGPGTLVLAGAVTDNSRNWTLSDGTLQISNTATQSLGGIISGTGGLAKNGSGTLKLTSANAYGGATTIGGGLVQLGYSPVPSIQNGSFETPGMSANSYTYYTSLTAAQKAQFVWNSTDNGGTGGCLLNNSAAWGFTMAYPNGSQMFSLQKDATLSQSLYLYPGTYTLSWSHAMRNTQVNPYYFQLDGTNWGSTISASSTAWAATNATFTIAAAGYHSIGFRGTTTASDQSVGLDNVSLSASSSVLGQLPALTAVNITASGAVLDLSGATQAIGSLAGVAGSSVTNNGALTAGGDNTSTLFAGTMAGSGPLTKTGAGTLTLSGTNTFTGELVFNAGIVNVSSLNNYGTDGPLGNRTKSADQTAGTPALHFTGGTLQYTGSTPQATDHHIRILNGAKCFIDASGTGAGTMSFTNTDAPINMWDTSGTRTLTLTGSNTSDNILALNIKSHSSGATTLAKTGAGKWVVTNPHNSDAQTDVNPAYGGYTGGTTIGGGTLAFASGALGSVGLIDITGTATLQWSGVNVQDFTAASRLKIEDGVTATFDTMTNNVTFAVPPTLGALKNASLAKAGSGTLTMLGANTYTNGTFISAGTLQLGNGTTDGLVLGNITNNGALTNGTISGTGTFSKSGNGAFTLTGGNSSPGTTAINGGRLNVSTIASFPNSAVTFAGGTTNGLQILSPGGQWTCAGLTYNTGTVYADLDFGIITPITNIAPIQVNGNLTINGTLQFIVRGSAVPAGTYPLITCTGTLLGTVPATVLLMPSRTSATLSQDANNIYMNVSSTQPLTWQPGDSFWDAGTFNWKDKAGTLTTYIDGAPGDSVVFDDTASGTSPITVTLDSLFNPASVTANLTNKNYTITGLGGISDGTVLFKNGSGTLTLLGTNTYSGLTFLSGGTLQLGDGTTRNGSVPGNISNNAALLFANAGAQTYAGAISGSGSLAKTGAGTLTLAGTNNNNTYSGPTIVSNGTLRLAKLDSSFTIAAATISTFTSDANSGIGTASPFGATDYTHALAFAQGANVVINGQTFTNTGTAASGTGWSVTNWPNNTANGNFPAGFQPASGGANTLLNHFYYGVGYVQTLVITGLTPGQTYDARIYYRAYSAVGNSRVSNWAFDPGTGTTTTLNAVSEDANANANILEFNYTVGPSGTLTMFATNVNAAFSWHLYGFSNQRIRTAGGSLPVATAVSVGSGATLDLNGTSPRISSLADIAGAGGLVTNSSPIGVGLSLLLPGGSTTFSGAMVGSTSTNSIGLNVGGIGSQTIGGGALLAGPLNVSNSTILNLAGNNALGNSVTVASNGALNVAGSNLWSGVITDSGLLSAAGYNVFSNSLTVNPGATLNMSGTNRFTTGALTANGTFNITNDLTVVGSGYFYVGQSAGSTSVVNQANGTVNLGQTNYSLLLGNSGVGNVGIYNLLGGTLNVTNSLTLGVNPNTGGIRNVANGTLNALGLLDVGRSDGTANTTNSFRMSGGSARAGTLNIAPSAANICAFVITNASFAASAFNYLAAGNGSVAHLALGPGAKVVLPPFPTTRGAGAVADITFDGGTLSPSVGSGVYLQGLNSAYLTANGAIFDVTNNITVAQSLTDFPSQNGTLTKNGPGMLVMTGASTYSGLTLINNGTLAFTIVPQGGGAVTVNGPGVLGMVASAPGATLGMSTLTLNAGGTIGFGIFSAPTAALMTATNLAVNGLVNVAISGGLPAGTTGSFPLLKLINGDISTFGPFQLSALPVGIGATLVTNTVNNTLDLNVTNTAALSYLVTWTGATNGNWDLITTNWQRDGTAGSYSELVPPGDAVLFDDTLVSNPTVSLTSGLWPLSVTVSNNNTNYVFGGSGRLSGGGSLTKLGAARLAITTWWSATPSAP